MTPHWLLFMWQRNSCLHHFGRVEVQICTECVDTPRPLPSSALRNFMHG